MNKKTYFNKIDCSLLATKIKSNIALAVEEIGDTPTLATIMVGDRADSAIYVARKKELLASVGMHSVDSFLPACVTTEDILELVHFYNRSEDINGILVQMPLPEHIDTRAVMEAIDKDKDVDGLTVENLGKLMANEEGLFPCTPSGVLEILKFAYPQYKGKKVMVIGRSILLGKSLSTMLTNEDCAVLNLHSKVEKSIKSYIDDFKPEILISCAGKKNLISLSDVKNSSVRVLIDCTIVREEGAKGIRGDFNKEEYDELDKTGIQWTSVPGGVGLLTVTMLACNLLKAYKLQD